MAILRATCTFGLESLLKYEMEQMGYQVNLENGYAECNGETKDIAKLNLGLRTADRVYIVLAEFSASTFDSLFEGVKAISWGDHLPQDAFIHVNGRSVKSALHSVPACQSIVKKAIIEAMSVHYKSQVFPETGNRYRIETVINKDIASILLDTSGEGLHKRGYRPYTSLAPLKETLAAAIIMFTRWKPQYPFADPMCGSGTIPIEAAMIAANIAPGLTRNFASESWGDDWYQAFVDERADAHARIIPFEGTLVASDIDADSIRHAKHNANRAGVGAMIDFEQRDLLEFTHSGHGGVIVCNPPYGERMDGGNDELTVFYKNMGNIFGQLDNWEYAVITAYKEFEKAFGRKSDKNRKLYNGNIKCYMYQYFMKKEKK